MVGFLGKFGFGGFLRRPWGRRLALLGMVCGVPGRSWFQGPLAGRLRRRMLWALLGVFRGRSGSRGRLRSVDLGDSGRLGLQRPVGPCFPAFLQWAGARHLSPLGGGAVLRLEGVLDAFDDFDCVGDRLCDRVPCPSLMDTGQRSWLASNHPSVVGRWARGLEKPKAGSSEESPNPKIQVLPRKSGPVRDFAGLSPGQFARHPGRTSEKDSMEEWGAEAIPGTRGRGKLNLESRNVLDPLAKRDVKQASRRP